VDSAINPHSRLVAYVKKAWRAFCIFTVNEKECVPKCILSIWLKNIKIRNQIDCDILENIWRTKFIFLLQNKSQVQISFNIFLYQSTLETQRQKIDNWILFFETNFCDKASSTRVLRKPICWTDYAILCQKNPT
jgi:hypothetical protein